MLICPFCLQDTLLQQNLSWDVPSGEFVQILHTEGIHWITINNINVSDTPGFSANTVNVYDFVQRHKSGDLLENITKGTK